MIKYQDLPPYANLNVLSNDERRKWIKKIDVLKRILIIPMVQRGKPKFQSKYDLEFNKVKNMINNDFSSLVNLFILCLRELGKENNIDNKSLKFRRLLISIFFGQQQYAEDDELKEYRDGFDYGHLKHLEKIYLSYHQNGDTYYLEMMKNLCSPYIDVMKQVVYMCKELFKESEDIDMGSLFGEGTEDYLG